MKQIKKVITSFKHGIEENKAVMILENRFGVIGYAFFYKLMEVLSATIGHYIYCDEVAKWEYFLAKVRMQDEQVQPMLDLLALLGVIDKELWEEDKCIFCEDLVQEFNKIYKRRKNMTEVEKPLLRSFFEQNQEKEEKDEESSVFVEEEETKTENSLLEAFLAYDISAKNEEMAEKEEENANFSQQKPQNSEENSQNKGKNLETQAKTPISAQIDTTTTSIYNYNNINNSSSSANLDFSEILAFWNENVEENLKVQYLTDERKNLIKLRFREFEGKTIEEKMNFCKQLIKKTTESDFLMGKSKNSTGWRASFNWLFKNSSNWRKVIENHYQEYENKEYADAQSKLRAMEVTARTAEDYDEDYF